MATPKTVPSATGELIELRPEPLFDRNTIWRVLAYILLLPTAVFVLLPFVWTLLSSLKENDKIFVVPMKWLPDTWQWSNYVEIWERSQMGLWLQNTVFLAVIITIIQVFTGSFAAYGFSRIKFPGRDFLFITYIATIAVPWQAYMIPQYKMMASINMVDNLWVIVLLQAFSAFGVFLMKQFYDTIPEELSEAARLDGLSEFGIYWRIMLPLSIPSIASLVIITFTNTWNDFMGPFLYLRNPDLWTIQIGLRSFIGEHATDYAAILTGSVISVIPIAIVFVLGQRHFVQGVATSGMK